MNKRDYLKDPTSCPYCGSSHISSGVIDTSNIAEVACDCCNREWVEVYNAEGDLTDVRPNELVECYEAQSLPTWDHDTTIGSIF